MLSPTEKQPTFARALLDQFSKLDRDHNGFVTQREIEKSLSDDQFLGETAACASTLYSKRSHIRKLSRLSNDQSGPERGISKKDVQGLQEWPSIPLEKRFQENLAKTKHFPAKLYSEGTPSPSGVYQGATGDCWLVAPLAALASQRPEELKHRIKALPSGQFSIQLPNGQTETVKSPTKTEQLTFTSGQNGELWANIYEKGVSQQRALFADEAISRKSLNWGAVSTGFKMVTGSGCNTDWLPVTRESTLRERVTQALEDKRVVVLATGKQALRALTGSSTDVEGIISDHCYSLLGYEEQSDELIIRNPWGSDGWTGDPEGENGVFKMPLTQVRDYFSTISYEVES